MKTILCVVLVFASIPCFASTHRDRNQRAAFVKMHPCPATGKAYGACPGYIVDHIDPLCNGGDDKPENMQWQTRSDSLVKDRWERKLCRGKRRAVK